MKFPNISIEVPALNENNQPPSQPINCKSIEKLISNGFISRATRKLLRNTKPAHIDQSSLQKINKLFPVKSEEAFTRFSKMNPYLKIDLKDIKRAIDTFSLESDSRIFRWSQHIIRHYIPYDISLRDNSLTKLRTLIAQKIINKKLKEDSFSFLRLSK